MKPTFPLQHPAEGFQNLGAVFKTVFLISNLCTLMGLFYLYRLGLGFFSAETTRRACVLFLLFPGSFFLSAFYKIQAGWGGTRLFDVDFSFPRHSGNMIVFLNSLLAVGWLALGAMMIRRRDPPVLWLYTLASVILIIWASKMYSWVRYSAVVFPAFFALSQLCEKRPTLERFMIYASAYFLSLFNLLYMNWYWAG